MALSDGRVVGTCRLLFRGQVARLGRLVVARELRRNGLAAEILDEATRASRGAGAERIELHAQTYAHELYERDGYEDVGERFFEEGIEHVAMEKPLA